MLIIFLTYLQKYSSCAQKLNIPILLWFSFQLIYLINTCNSHYAYNTADRMKSKIFFMDRELIFEAKSLIQSIRHYRPYYQETPAFQIAEVVYDLRRQYARMIFVYKKCCKLLSTDEEKRATFLNFLMEIQQIHMDIDKLVEQILEWDYNREKTIRISKRIESKPKKSHKGNSTNSTEGDLEADNKKEKLILRADDIEAEKYIKRQKQRSYLERKKLAWAMSMGVDRKTAKNMLQRKREIMEEGFNSDLN